MSLLIFRQCFYLENYISKKLIQDVRTKYQAKKSKSKKSNEDDVYKQFLN